jgi:hypothetical protein
MILNEIKYARDQSSEDVCLAAVESNLYNLKLIKNQTSKMCSIAVSKNGYAI